MTQSELDEVRNQVVDALAAVARQREIVELERRGGDKAEAAGELAGLTDALLLRLKQLDEVRARVR